MFPSRSVKRSAHQLARRRVNLKARKGFDECHLPS